MYTNQNSHIFYSRRTRGTHTSDPYHLQYLLNVSPALTRETAGEHYRHTEATQRFRPSFQSGNPINNDSYGNYWTRPQPLMNAPNKNLVKGDERPRHFSKYPQHKLGNHHPSDHLTRQTYSKPIRKDHVKEKPQSQKKIERWVSKPESLEQARDTNDTKFKEKNKSQGAKNPCFWQTTKAALEIDSKFRNDEEVKAIINQHFKNVGALQIMDETIVRGKRKTSCMVILTTDGLLSAQNIIKNMCEDLSTTLCKEVKFYICNLTEGSSSSMNPSEINHHVSDTAKRKNMLAEIDAKCQSALKKHKQKLSEKETRHIELLRLSDEDSSSEIKALEDKMDELKKQSEMFLNWCSTVNQTLHNIDPAKTSKTDLTAISQKFGMECQRLLNALPMYARRQDIIDKVFSDQVSIILGETGSGKSTQLVQYLYEAGLAKDGLIVCTQPRKVAAITLAERVAQEMVSQVGQIVGYKTGIKEKISSKTKIVFSTDHSLLNECLKDKYFSGYSCIIVDEAHERSIYTDLLLGLIKTCLPKRPELKVVITSATIDPGIFIKYFNSTPELRVSGRLFPVEVIYDDCDTDVEFDDHEKKALAKALEVHRNLRNEEPGDILVFLTAAEEIMRCCEEFKKQMKEVNNFQCFPLHGKLPPEEQKKVFEHLGNNKRKIVFATNCAETSITIDGIKYVIDTGVAKEVKYDAKKNISILGTHVISKSSADQRKGRAGRTMTGKCFRLYSESGYMSMEPSSKPEILRSHLGQAVLKLAALGINCSSYEFVESPGKEAIDAAVSTLCHLGAMSKVGITDLGMWINKLPFDPRQGFLIYNGFKENVLYDSVVIASLLNNGNNIFYKGMSDIDQQKSSKSKIEYGSPDGDVFTWLEVYKDWSKEATSKKSTFTWCKEKCINYKVLSYTKECVKEMAQILAKEAKIEIKHSFGDTRLVTSMFKKLIFQAYMPSLSHYLGHFRAGYYALEVQKQVHFHPSSSLLSLNSKPEWIVYTEFMKTTKDFVKGISVVDELWVQEALQEGRLSFNLEEVSERKIELVHREELGFAMFRNLVGPKYKHLRELEEELTSHGMTTAVVEADRETGTIDIYSSSAMNADAAKELEDCKQAILGSLVLDEDEIPVVKNKKGSDGSGFRVVLGQGAQVKTLLMPDESNKIIIKKSSLRTSEDEIWQKFSAYGEVVECVKFKSCNSWGFIRYRTKAEAKLAVESTADDEHNVASLKTEFERRKAQSKFEAKVICCRRPIIGSGTAFIKCSSTNRDSFVGHSILLSHGCCDIKQSNKSNDLICFNTGMTTEQELTDKILALVDNDKRAARQLFVTINRFKVEAWKDEVPEITYLIEKELKKCATASRLPNTQFQINLLKPKDSTINYTGFIHFDSITQGEQLCRAVNNFFPCFPNILGERIQISPSFKTFLQVPASIMMICKADFEEITEYLKEKTHVEVKVKEMKLGDFGLDIKSTSAKHLVEARDLFQMKLDGEIIDCGVSELTRNIFKKEGRKMLHQIEEELAMLIIVDERKEKIHLYGTCAKVSRGTIKINEFLDKLFNGKTSDIILYGNEKPPGLMKEIMKNFGYLPGGIIEHFQLTDAKIDFKQQKLSICGPPELVDQAEHSIADIEKKLAERVSHQQEKWMPDCVVCMCPVEAYADLYRLEGCGHAYCYACLKVMVSLAVEDKKFPIDCAFENCSMALVWKDIRFCFKQKWISETKVAQRSLDSLVATNIHLYKFCKTANCPVVYEITDCDEGNEFNCPACLVSLCTSCHANYHVGISCKMFASQEESDKLFEKWKMDSKNCKECPGCRTPAEKIEGCNKIRCCSCKVIFCWLCLEKFPDSQECYKHLQKKHGGFI